MRAKIIGTASAGKHSKIRELGIENLIDYQSEDFSERVMEMTQGKGVDLVMDSLEERSLQRAMLVCLSLGGRRVWFFIAVTGPKRSYLKILPKFLKMPSFSPRDMMMKNKEPLDFIWE